MTGPRQTKGIDGAIVVMGVSGCGKSSMAAALADALDWTFVEGDLLHPAANLAKMAAAIPLDDRDRQPFLDAVGAAISGGAGIVASCSALKRVYRDHLRRFCGNVTFILPMVPRSALQERLRWRQAHFMPAALLDSQLATLEPPETDEAAILVDGDQSLADQVAAVLTVLRGSTRAASR